MDKTFVAILVLMTAVIVAVAVTRVLRLPSLLAYLSVGVALGPHGLAVFAEGPVVNHLAEFGVVFLMFSIGLEFSLSRLKAMHRLVFGLGAAQVGVTLFGTVAVTVIYYGQDWRVGIAVGAACAMSSTAIVAKLLSERFELHTHAGRQTMSVLLFQDLLMVPLLVIIPALAAPAGNLGATLGVAFLVALATLALVGLVGPRLMRTWFGAVARYRSDEFFMLSVLWIVVVLAGATAWAGLSLALGAFLAGVLISETVYRHQVEADIRPFRDVLLGLFFVTIGMQLDLGYMLGNLGGVVLALLLFIGAKAGIMLAIAAAVRNPPDVALRTAAQLAQAGEFGFVLLELGRSHDLVPPDVLQVTMAAMLLSMFIAPLLIDRAARLGGQLARSRWTHDAKVVHDIAVHSMSADKHVIVCGFGRAGQAIARFLTRESIPFIALDLDAERVRQASAAGDNVVFGNAERREVLTAAGLGRARAVVVTYSDIASSERVLHQVRQMREDIPVVVRAEDDSDFERLKTAGASEVIPEVLEGSLMLAAQTLAELGVPVERTMDHVRAARAERYASLREFYNDQRSNSGR